MRAVCLKNETVTVRHDYPKPMASDEFALIRVTLAGVCNTDLEIMRGYIDGYNGIMGHEFCGVVKDAVQKEWIGKRICAGINIVNPTHLKSLSYRGVCVEHHPLRTVLGIINQDGCFADYVLMPIRNLIEIPDTVSDDMAVFTEPLAAALRIRDQVCVKPTSKIAVVGAGKLGLLIAKVLNAAGSDVCVYRRSDNAKALLQKWKIKSDDISHAANSSHDFVVEATGNVEGFRESLRITAPMGTIVLKSTFAGEAKIDLTKVVVDEIKIVGSRCGPMAAAMRMLERGEIDVTDLIDGRFSIDDALQALEVAQRKGTKKILITMDQQNEIDSDSDA